MARLDTYLTQTAFHRIKKNILLVNLLQLTSCLVELVVFVISFSTSQAGNAYSPFSMEFQTVALGLYLLLPIGSIILSIDKNPDETSLLFSEALTILAIGIGVLPVVVIFQGYIDLTLPLLFAVGYLLNIPVLAGRTAPLLHISYRKRRGTPVGRYGNLTGIQMEIHVSWRRALMLYALLLGVPAVIVLGGLISQGIVPPEGLGGLDATLFAVIGGIFACVVIVGTVLVHALRGRIGWQKVTLDTYEKDVLWWYDPRGSLVPMELHSPHFTSMHDNQVKLSMVKGGLPTDLKFYSIADLDRFLHVVNPSLSSS